MKISYGWLQDFADIDRVGRSPSELAQVLSMIGFPVESVEASGDDILFDVEVTTNRPDCLNHLGVARELAAQLQLKLRKPDSAEPSRAADQALLPADVIIEKPELCPRYAARVMTGVRIAESPAWMKARLESVGQRPINNIVDITNYVLIEVGHPLHAFDYEKLAERRIVVRTARAGEKLVTLDGVERILDPSMLMICDAQRPVALAGIMGGHESEITAGTQTILLESAYFSPASIRATAKKLAVRTEASYRFERGADPEMPVPALHRVCSLIQEIAGGACVSPVIDRYPQWIEPRRVELTQERMQRVVGMPFDPDFVVDLLRRLEFQLLKREGGKLQFQVPTFRPDVEIEDDLVEEVARHYGYDRIQSTYPAATVPGGFLPTAGHDRVLTTALQGFGFFEAINYVFATPRLEALFWGRPQDMIAIANPLTEEDTHLRTTLVPGLVESVRRNLNHGNKNVRLFEFGQVFLPGPSGRLEDYQETARLGLAATGAFYQPFWNPIRDSFEFFHLKGMVQTLIEKLDQKPQFQPASQPFLRPGGSVEVWVNGELRGWLGELHPRLRQAYKFLQKIFVAELFLDPLYAHPLAEPLYVGPPRFPAVESDLSFVVDKEVEFGRMIDAIQGLSIPELAGVQLIDLYQGAKLPKGKVSLTVRLTFLAPERTLTQEEVNRHLEGIFSVLGTTFAAEARS